MTRTSLFALILSLAVLGGASLSSPTQAGSNFGPNSPSLNLDLAGNVDLQASPTEVAPGGSVVLNWYSFFANNCVTNFPYSPITNPYNMDYDGDGVIDADPTYYPAGQGTVNPMATTTYTITCVDEFSRYAPTLKYVTDSVTIGMTVPVVVATDLTTGSASPSTGLAGQAVALSATVTNTGQATPAGFTNLFQRATSSGGAGATDIGTYVRATSLASAGTFAATLSHTFPSAGVWYVRACADKSSGASTGSVTESDEANNCGAWTAVTISTVTQCNDGINNDNTGGTDFPADTDCTSASHDTESPAVTVNLTGNPTTVVTGGTSTLTWSSTNATTCVNAAGEGVGGFSTGGARNSSDVTSPLTANATYQIRCTGAGGTVTDSELITVNTPVAHIAVNPDRVASGNSTTLSFSATGVTGTCIVTRGVGGTTIWGPTAGPTIATTTASSGNLTKQTTFEISCDSGAAKDSVLVNIIPEFDEF